MKTKKRSTDASGVQRSIKVKKSIGLFCKVGAQKAKDNSSHGDHEVKGRLIRWRSGEYYLIEQFDLLEPFLVSIMSSSDLWMYVSSRTGLTAGRRDADHALFPYETEDKLHVSHYHTGPRTIVRCKENSRTYLWQPFSECGRLHYRLKRVIYKHIYGCEIWFEELNISLGLIFRFGWQPSERFGWIRKVEVQNVGEKSRILEILDGVQNILPAGVLKQLQDTSSSLVDAYKYAECDKDMGLAIFGLESRVSDRPEPSESLYVTVAWQVGLGDAKVILDSNLAEEFMCGQKLNHQAELKGKRGSYLLAATINLPIGKSRSWKIVLDTPVDHAGVVELKKIIRKGADNEIEDSIDQSRCDLECLLASADGFQKTGDSIACAHHLANVLYNIGRGGVPKNGYMVETSDFADFLSRRNKGVFQRQFGWLKNLPRKLSLFQLAESASRTDDLDLIRLCDEYLPLFFSRRHGDPSRPWNRFSILVKKHDGSTLYSYEGNWRDIFQNWEALCYSFPGLLRSVIAKFLNASTPDGFNPYRVDRNGIDWEVPDPSNPWSSIGYWGDHQIVYLLRLLEAYEAHYPGELSEMLTLDRFSYADVPYRIKAYSDIIRNPRDTIVFDWQRHAEILAQVEDIGTDARLLRISGSVLHVNLAEKLLVPILAKISNLVPGGGIWMNTMRPEWNDANNALAGFGLSVVTACHLYRHLGFCLGLFERAKQDQVLISRPVVMWLGGVKKTLEEYALKGCSRNCNKDFIDKVGHIFSDYRFEIYNKGIGHRVTVSMEEICGLLKLAKKIVGQTIRENRRKDGLYHSYNILHFQDGKISVSRLPLMLEGQVAVLSSGLLEPDETLKLLNALMESSLYRKDKGSYMLYPLKRLPRFLQRNRAPSQILRRCPNLKHRILRGDRSILIEDAEGVLHFSPQIDNARILHEIASQELPRKEVELLLQTYENVFKHAKFTGRSGSMYAYEGIGCIYWHMVGKLLVAIEESLKWAVAKGASKEDIQGIRRSYHQILSGMGFKKEPKEFGAFPLDPYSHTPLWGGARQPGLSGQVKEEIIARWAEIGIIVEDGRIGILPVLLRKDEFLEHDDTFEYIDLSGDRRQIRLSPGCFALTYCQVPMIFCMGRTTSIQVKLRNGKTKFFRETFISRSLSNEIFRRTGRVEFVKVTIDSSSIPTD